MSIGIEKLQITKSEKTGVFVDSFRSKLVNVYKNLIYDLMKSDESFNNIDGLLIQTVGLMKASDEEILNAFFECLDAHISGDEIPSYIDEVLETVAQFY